MSAEELIAAGHAIDVREGDPELDAVDGVTPALVIEPHTPDGVAAALAWAAQRKLAVLVQGAGSKREWGDRPSHIDVILGMRRLNRLVLHRQADLTVTAEAGLPLRDLNERLRAHGQQLPLDPPESERATIGGLLATNDSGPSRHRYGTPRDLVLGVQLATTDGRLTKAGGQVVKNVAGYDVAKLVCGSFGSLAAIVSATFKLLPLPPASTTVAFDAGSADRLARIVESIAAGQTEPAAFEVYARRPRGDHGLTLGGLIRFASVAAAVQAQAAEVSRCLTAAGARHEIIAGHEEQRVWRAHAFQTNQSDDAVVRVSWPPAGIVSVIELLSQIGAGVDIELAGRLAVGAGLLRLGGDAMQQAAAIRMLRDSGLVGNVVVRRAPRELQRLVDVWGPPQNARVLEALKRAFDPSGTLVGRQR